ncbi:hypothetical protein [Nocardia sp. NPDC058633]|uniref:hypothetical protein n=1 Tax=Nocardia sp. NPDC058633 TaxID=3346568 RepID=UPI00364806C9
MPHGPDIAALTRLSTTNEGAADMARYTTVRRSLDDAVREILTAPEPLTPTSRPQAVRRTEVSFSTHRRQTTGSAIRGSQNRSTTVRRPMRIPR